ncbi:hypothetical protein [Streptomyces niveus]|uniref:hypothetical protein n=1 Tax=Streptomyces niveus TaxID=193462 RepID=UPI00366212D4
MADIFHVLLLLDAKLFGHLITPERPRVEFGDGTVDRDHSARSPAPIDRHKGQDPSP